MADLYVDSSALLKPYVPEAGSQWMEAMMLSNRLTISWLTIA